MREEIIKAIFKQNNLQINNLTKDRMGKNYYVYLTDEYVIKIPKSKLSKRIYKKEFDFYKNFNLDFVPDFVAEGKYKKYDYLIIKRIEGKTLFDEYSNFSREQIVKYFKQICQNIRAISKLDYKEYAQQNEFLLDDMGLAYSQYLDDIVKRMKKCRINTTKLEYIKDKVVEIIFRNCKPVLLYNDFHFGNFIVNKTGLFMIDFDYNICQPLDYFCHSIKMAFSLKDKCIAISGVDDTLEDEFLKIYLDFFKDEIDDRYFEQRQVFYDFCFEVNQVVLRKKLFPKNIYKRELKKLEDYFFIEE